MTVQQLTHELTKTLPTVYGIQSELSVSIIPHGFEIKYAAMYEAPMLTIAMLKQLSTLFNTDNIDVNNYAMGGCDTCDWGSSYGNTIQIRGVSDDVLAAVSQLSGKNLYRE